MDHVVPQEQPPRSNFTEAHDFNIIGSVLNDIQGDVYYNAEKTGNSLLPGLFSTNSDH